MAGDEPIVLSVNEYFSMEGLNNGNFPVTTEVRDQLAELLQSAPGPQIDALFRAIMTTVMNLELAHVNVRSSSMEVYSRLLDLETRVRQAGVRLGYPKYPDPVEF